MYNSIVDAIVLTGQDSIRFVNSLYRPSSEEVEHARRILNEITPAAPKPTWPNLR